ncbi:MAG: class I SAM-dependent methyltransferase [Phycisphaerae bacterium]|nr:class I SAM-dependent methyltransferase [Phycisphaerae bacterium]
MDFQERTEQRYKAHSGRTYHESKRSIPDAAYPWVARMRAEKIAPYVSASDTVLEYGVGMGWNLAALACKRRVGYDLAAHLEAEVREHNIDFITDLGTLATGSVDVVICHHVLEHTPDPAKVLEEMRSLLKADGRLLLFVPFEKERRYRRYDPAEPNHHVYSWNVQTLGNLVADCGFAIDEARTARFGYDRFGALWSTRLGLGDSGYRLIRRLVHVVAPMLEVRVAARKSNSEELA